MYPRFKYWVMLLVSSVVVCFSFLSYQRDIQTLGRNWTIQDRWVFLLSMVSIVLAILGVIATIYPQQRPVCRIESILVWFTVILWSVGTITTIINPFDSNGDGVTDGYISLHPSVFFFSVVCLLTSVVMMASWFKQYVVSDDSPSTTYWILLAAMSFFTLISSIGFRNSTAEVPLTVIDNDSNSTNIPSSTLNSTIDESILVMTNTTTIQLCEATGYDCRRVTFAICLSAVSAVSCIVVVPWTSVGMRCQTDLSLTLFTAWLVGAFFLTTTTGPATNFGTLYFGVWICVFLSLRLLIIVSTSESTVETKGHDGTELEDNGVTRMEIFDVAYDAIGRRAANRPNRSDSYKDLFVESEDWINLTGSSNSVTLNGSLLSQRFSQQSCGKTYDPRQVHRLELWSVLLVASSICLASMHLSQIAKNQVGTFDKVALSVPVVSLFTCSAGIGTVLRSSQKSTIVEATALLISVIMWVIVLPVVSNRISENLLGFEKLDDPHNNEANLFFSCWVGVITAILLTTNWFNASTPTTDFILLASSSLALFANSFEYRQGEENAESCSRSDNPYACGRVMFAVYGGGICALISLLMAFFHRISHWFHFIVSIVFVLLWGFAVAVISFSGGHGKETGTIFFAVWLNVFLSVDLVTMNFLILWRERMDRMSQGREDNDINDISNDIDHENIDNDNFESDNNMQVDVDTDFDHVVPKRSVQFDDSLNVNNNLHTNDTISLKIKENAYLTSP